MSAAASTPPWVWVGTAAITALAFALRISGIGQSLFGDELYLYALVHDQSFGDMLAGVADTESTPPLHFVLAWLSAQLGGDPTEWVRLPSVLAGTAAVPATFLLGRRTVGVNAGLLGAAVIALSPFMIFYSTENRAYATIACLAALFGLALVVALERGGRRRWLLLWAAALALLLTHYTTIFVVAAGLGWALWAFAGKRRDVLMAHAAVALAYLPWVPFMRDEAAGHIGALYPIDPETVGRTLLKTAMGHPFVGLADVPGTAALVLAGAAVLIPLAGILLTGVRAETEPGLALVSALAVATPLGLFLWSVPGESIFLPRNLTASIPAAALLAGGLVLAARRPLGVIGVGLAVAALAIGSVRMLDGDHARPDFKSAAQEIDAGAEAHDPVVEVAIEGPPGQELGVNLRKPHLHLAVVRVEPRGFVQQAVADPRAWSRPGRPRVRVIGTEQNGFRLPVAPPGSGYRLERRRVFDGFIPVTLTTWTNAAILAP